MVRPVNEHGHSPTEREILRVLWANPDQHLVRSEIHKRMPQEHRRTLGRIGQILSAFDEAGFLEKVQRRAQGSRRAAFYALSEDGLELCRALGFEREAETYFPADPRTLATYLTPQHLATDQFASGRFVTFYAYRSGLGKTTALAHTARGLAEADRERKVLVLDLDFDTSGPDAFFAPDGLGPCQGLRGLIVDFARQRQRSRNLWLRGAAHRAPYTLQPFEDLPNFTYLPHALGPGAERQSTAARAEAFRYLHGEAGLAPAGSQTEPAFRQASFLSTLTTALTANFDKVLINAENGWGLGAWIGIQALGESLVLCLNPSDTSSSTLSAFHAIVANYVRRGAEANALTCPLFLFFSDNPLDNQDLSQWISKNIVRRDIMRRPGSKYAVEQINYNLRLKENPKEWRYSHFFSNLTSRLGNVELTRTRATPEYQALTEVLNPEAPTGRRSIAAGFLSNCPSQALEASLRHYSEHSDESLAPDGQSRTLVSQIIDAHARKFSKHLKRLEESLFQIRLEDAPD